MATNQNGNHRVSHPSPSQTGETPMVGPHLSLPLPTVDGLQRGGDQR